jgi:hypothetical protein
VRAPKERAPHRKVRRLVTLRLPAFRFLHLCLEVLIWRSSTEDRKTGATPALSLHRTGFAFDVIVFCRRAFAPMTKVGRQGAPR